MNCPIPVESRLYTGDGVKLPCGEKADVLTEVPGVDRNTGQTGIMRQLVCLNHSVSIASWKLIQNLLIWEREQAKDRRIIVADSALVRS